MQNILERLNYLIIKTFLIDDISRMHERIMLTSTQFWHHSQCCTSLYRLHQSLSVHERLMDG